MIILITTSPVGGFWSSITNRLTESVFCRPKDIKTIEHALTVKREPILKQELEKTPSGFQYLLSKIKIGHLIGLGWISTVLFGEYAKNKFNLDDKSLFSTFTRLNFPFGTVGSIGAFLVACFGKNTEEESTKGKLDTFVRRLTVNADGSTIGPNNVEDDDFPSLNDVIMPDINRQNLLQALSITHDEQRGGIFLLRGITRCGKTMTTRAAARYLAENSPNKKAYWWYATDNTMERSLADHERFLGSIFGSETTAQRLERILSRAILEDAPVVVVLDEAHMMLGSEGRRTGSYDPNDPNQTSSIVEAIKKLVSEKLKTKKCPNVYLFLTANSSGNAIAAPMQGRMDTDIFYDKPDKDDRKQLITSTLKKQLELKKDLIDLKFEDFTPEDIESISEIGTENLLKQFSDTDDERAYSEAVLKGFGGDTRRLENRPLLTYELIEFIVKGAIVTYIQNGCKGGKNALIDSIENSLKQNVESILRQRSWEGELLYYFGSGKVKGNQSSLNRDELMQVLSALR